MNNDKNVGEKTDSIKVKDVPRNKGAVIASAINKITKEPSKITVKGGNQIPDKAEVKTSVNENKHSQLNGNQTKTYADDKNRTVNEVKQDIQNPNTSSPSKETKKNINTNTSVSFAKRNETGATTKDQKKVVFAPINKGKTTVSSPRMNEKRNSIRNSSKNEFPRKVSTADSNQQKNALPAQKQEVKSNDSYTPSSYTKDTFNQTKMDSPRSKDPLNSPKPENITPSNKNEQLKLPRSYDEPRPIGILKFADDINYDESKELKSRLISEGNAMKEQAIKIGKMFGFPDDISLDFALQNGNIRDKAHNNNNKIVSTDYRKSLCTKVSKARTQY